MSASLIDGKAIAARLRADLAARIAARTARGLPVPGLAVVLIGDDPASQVYVRSKHRACEAAGIRSFVHHLPSDTDEATLLALVARLNADADAHGILVQLPLPAAIDSARVIAAIDPDKDVDGFHPVNMGRLATGLPGFVPCTPLGCVKLIETVLGSGGLSGKNVVVIGRSNIVGKPLALLLTARDATVTLAHSRTRPLPEVVRRGDVVVAAVGRPEMVRGNWLQPGAIVIDVGINRVQNGADSRLVGDVVFKEALEVAGTITPVPGGVGPMTIACLLENTLSAAERASGEQASDQALPA